MIAPAPSVEAVCRMPEEFARRGDISMIDLLKESGCLNDPTQMTEEELRRYIDDTPGHHRFLGGPVRGPANARGLVSAHVSVGVNSV